MTDHIRCFIACDLSLSVLDALAARQRELCDAIGDAACVRWASPATMHLTLKFLGDRVDPGVTDVVGEAVRGVAEAHPPFQVELAGLGAFPSAARPRVLWASVAGDSHLLGALAEAVEEATEALGFARERRGFSPHVTLGRLRSEQPGADLTEPLAAFEDREIGGCRIGELVLFRSVLTPKGASYEALVRAPLTGRRIAAPPPEEPAKSPAEDPAAEPEDSPAEEPA